MPSKHVWLARTMAGILLIVAVAAALCAAILLPYFLAKWFATIPLLVFISIVSCFFIVWVGARVCSRLWGAGGGARFATQVAGVLTLVFAASLFWLILKPTADPGPAHPLEDIRYYDYRRTDAHEQPFPKLRFLAALLLVGRNPGAAQNLVSQREAEGLLIPIVDWQIRGTVCKGDSDRLPQDLTDFQAAHDNPGMNPYVLQHLASEPNSPDGDPHAALRKDHTPAILLYSQCDFIDWSGALDYRRTMPNLKTYYIPHAGHYIQFEQPELMRRIMAAFLLDQPDVIAPVDSDEDPRLKPSTPNH
jgi:pimeloyl-ACP methyl ester carboxylesterase